MLILFVKYVHVFGMLVDTLDQLTQHTHKHREKGKKANLNNTMSSKAQYTTAVKANINFFPGHTRQASHQFLCSSQFS